MKWEIGFVLWVSGFMTMLGFAHFKQRDVVSGVLCLASGIGALVTSLVFAHG